MLDFITIILILVLIYLLYHFNYLNFIIKKENFRGGGGGGGRGGSGLGRGGGGLGRGSGLGGGGLGGDGLGGSDLGRGGKLLPVTNTNSFQNAAYTLDTTAPDINITNNKVDNAEDYPKIVKGNMPNYNKLLGDDDKEVTYYYNDVINQSNISENADDLINQKDLIDYASVKTGLQKCEENCKGVCFELGYMGTATCYPPETKTFDYGSIYKNPTFTYG
jgi:hypothetical protein